MTDSIKFINKECELKDITGSSNPQKGFVVFEKTCDSFPNDVIILIKLEGSDLYSFVCSTALNMQSGVSYYDTGYQHMYYSTVEQCLKEFY